uniref:Adenosine kinase n=1 Tax=Meloidogyne javanica TaxID=6303 RepID=A0A915MDM2_MELJA
MHVQGGENVNTFDIRIFFSNGAAVQAVFEKNSTANDLIHLMIKHLEIDDISDGEEALAIWLVSPLLVLRRNVLLTLDREIQLTTKYEKLAQVLYFDARDKYLCGKYSVDIESSLELVGLQLAIEFGPCNGNYNKMIDLIYDHLNELAPSSHTKLIKSFRLFGLSLMECRKGLENQVYDEYRVASTHFHNNHARYVQFLKIVGSSPSYEVDPAIVEENKRVFILGIGNPLLDKQLETVDTKLHEKYNLKTDSASFTDLDELKDSIKSIPGGSAQNTLRVFQWVLGAIGGPTSKAAAYFGAVGDDNNAEHLKCLATKAGLVVRYQLIPNQKTGVCAVLVYGTDRCLVAHLGAAEKFTSKHLDIPENKLLLEKAENYYAEVWGYFLTVCPEAILQIAKHAADKNKPFTMSLSAAYICKDFLPQLNFVLPYVDVLFGNEEEANAYAEANNFKENDLEKIVKKIASYEKINTLRSRLVVITRGENSVFVAIGSGEFQTFPVDTIERNLIKDTNGAGDAFSGGFLAALANGRPLEKCVKSGNFAARTIIQNVGCTFPDNCDYKEE